MMLGWGWVTSCQTLQLGPWGGSFWCVVGGFWPAVKVFHGSGWSHQEHVLHIGFCSWCSRGEPAHLAVTHRGLRASKAVGGYMWGFRKVSEGVKC